MSELDPKAGPSTAYRWRVPEEADWPAILDIAMQALPDAEAENREWWENRREIDDQRQRRRHTVLENDRGDVIGYGAVEEGPEQDLFRMFIVASPRLVQEGLGDALYAFLMSELQDLGANLVWVREESRDPVVRFFQGKGFAVRTRFNLENGREAIVLYKELGGLS